MGKFHELNFGITQTINAMLDRGISLKKEQMIKQMKTEYLKNHDSLKGFDYRKNPYIRSLKSADAMRQEQKIFVKFCHSIGIKKFEHVDRHILQKYLLSRNDKDSQFYSKSAWSISRSLHFANKLWQQDITKRELSLPSRLQRNVTRGRNGQPKDRPLIIEKNRAAIDLVSATGMRRSSVTRVTYSCFNFLPDGSPVSVTLPPEKGGKIRTSYILPSMRSTVLDIITPFKDSTSTIIQTVSKDLNLHWYRHEYAESLLNQLLEEHSRGEKYFRNGEFECHFNITKKERAMQNWHNIPVQICGMISSNLGHNRVCILASYIWDK